MKKAILSLFSVFAIVLAGGFYTFSQVKIYYPSQKSSSENFTVELSNVIGLANELKFKIEIENTTSEFMIYDASKSFFILNGEPVALKKDILLVIEPYQKRSKTIAVTGTGMNAIRTFKFELNGMQKVVLTDEVFPTEMFTLPPSKNDFSTGSFLVDLKNFKKETGATVSKFNVQYTGKAIGFVFPSKITTSMPDGKEYANGKTADPILLFPGKSSSIQANWERMPGGSINDMQKVEMQLNFTNVFREGATIDLNAQSFDFNWDEALTKSKNK